MSAINVVPILILELGHLQVFCYQSMNDWMNKIPPTEVFWQKRGETTIHGPFTNAYLAIADYSVYITRPPTFPLGEKLIHIDFKAKKRINP